MTNYLQRDITPTILEALKEMPVVVLTGMRQTGKSTFLECQKEFEGRKYVSFDDFEHLTAAKGDPASFIAGGIPLSIDEAQKCPEILTAIKNSVGRKRRPGHFLLSGSANFAMLKAISESLAGRAVYFTLHPLTRRELAGQINEKPFLRICLESGIPPKRKPLSPLTEEEALREACPRWP